MGSALSLGCSSFPRQRTSRSEIQYALGMILGPSTGNKTERGKRDHWSLLTTHYLLQPFIQLEPKSNHVPQGLADCPRGPVPRLHLKNLQQSTTHTLGPKCPSQSRKTATVNNSIHRISLHEGEMQRSEMLDLLPPQMGG